MGGVVSRGCSQSLWLLPGFAVELYRSWAQTQQPGTLAAATAAECGGDARMAEQQQRRQQQRQSSASHAPDAAPAAREWRCLTYNVFGGGVHSDLRLPHLSAVVEAAEPDVLCLQEATPTVVATLQTAANLPHAVTKLELLESANDLLAADDRDAVCAAGFLAVLSKHPLANAKLVHGGGWLDDGILSVEVSGFGVVYNVHLVRSACHLHESCTRPASRLHWLHHFWRGASEPTH